MARGTRIIAATLASCAALVLAAAGGAAASPSARTAAPLPPDDATALALKFRPRLLFDAKERWRPIDVDQFLAEPGHQACAPAGGPCTPLTSLAQLTPAVDHLDLRGTAPNGSDAVAPDLATCAKSLPALRDCDKGGRSVIYAHVTRKGRRLAIDYWWFLRYNAYTLDQHEGDWEGVTVIVDPFGTKVLDVHFAAHSDVWRYTGDTPQLVDNRLKVYVARGSHAAYPSPCRRLCRGTSGVLPEARFGGERSWVGNSAAGCRRRCVRLLPPASGAPQPWNAWQGRWGVTLAPAFAPPLTPAFQRRYRQPFSARTSGRHTF